MPTENLNLSYTILCDDVRLEAGNKISLMGVFQNIMVEQLPVSLIKFAVVNHWLGTGIHETEIRILSPDRRETVVVSQSTRIELTSGGFSDNVSFFVNIVFPIGGTYWVQTFADSVLMQETPMIVADIKNANNFALPDEIDEFPEIIN